MKDDIESESSIIQTFEQETGNKVLKSGLKKKKLMTNPPLLIDQSLSRNSKFPNYHYRYISKHFKV